jgi:hypothetical protein
MVDSQKRELFVLRQTAGLVSSGTLTTWLPSLFSTYVRIFPVVCFGYKNINHILSVF